MESEALNESKRWLVCSVISKATDAIIATSKRVFMEGPVANKSFIAGCLFKVGWVSVA